ncbi:MAG: HEAT repeat domain-containing protein [Armatimonadia bacterium]
MSEERSILELERMLREDFEGFQLGAIRALGEHSDKTAAMRVLKEAMYFSSCYIRAHAAWAFRAIGTPEAMERINELLEDRHCEVRHAAADARYELMRDKKYLALVMGREKRG